MGSESDFVPCFCTVFTILGLKVLFGSKPVTLGSVLLLACMSSAASTAWVGGTGGWVEGHVTKALNHSSLTTASAAAGRALRYVTRVMEEREYDEL